MRQGAGPAGVRQAGRGRRLIRLALAFLLLLIGASPALAQAPPDTLRSGTLRVIHAPRHAALAREVMAQAVAPMPLPGFGRGAAPDSTTIVLATSPRAFLAATGGRTPEWAGGVAMPYERTIVIPAYPVPGVDRRQADATLRHEIVHLVLHERLPGTIPRWFDEGYAEVASGSWNADEAWALRVAFMLGRAPPLDSLELAWPAGEGQARLAYLLSATMVDHLRRRAGERGFQLLLHNWRRLGTLDAAIRETFAMTPGQLEDEWKKAVRSRYGWLQMGANVGAVWGVALLLALVAWIPRRRRNRARVAEMEREYHMLPPPRDDGVSVEYPLAEEDEE